MTANIEQGAGVRQAKGRFQNSVFSPAAGLKRAMVKYFVEISEADLTGKVNSINTTKEKGGYHNYPEKEISELIKLWRKVPSP